MVWKLFLWLSLKKSCSACLGSSEMFKILPFLTKFRPFVSFYPLSSKNSCRSLVFFNFFEYWHFLGNQSYCEVSVKLGVNRKAAKRRKSTPRGGTLQKVHRKISSLNIYPLLHLTKCESNKTYSTKTQYDWFPGKSQNSKKLKKDKRSATIFGR